MLHKGFRIDTYLPTSTLILLFQDPDQPPEKRWAACLALGSKPDKEAFDVLEDALSSEDWRIRRFAVEAVKRHELAPRAEAAIAVMLFDVDDIVRQTACRICGELNFESAHDGLLQLLHDDNPDVRDTALSALARLWREGDFDPVFLLYQNDPARAVRIAAAKALRRRATPDTWRTLFDAWSHDKEPRHRMWATELAAKFGVEEVAEAVAGLAQEDPNPNVRSAAAKALRRGADT
jgi:HEAT repeat protein